MKKILRMLLISFLLVIFGAGCNRTNNSREDVGEPNVVDSKESLDSDIETGMENKDINEQEPIMIQTFAEKDVAVIPEVEQYDFARAKEKGIMQQIRGMLPGMAEGIWYTISIDGVEYYYGKYDFQDEEAADCYGFAIFSDSYALENGITIGQTMDEILEKYPDMAVMDFEGNYLNKEVTGHQGWNGFVYPRSYIGMDEDWEYNGKDYEWSDRFDCIMIADIDLEMEDTLPVYVALMVKDNIVMAITFYYPTAG